LASANEVLFDEIPANMFVTCFFGVLNLEAGQLRFANAGHCLPIKLTGNGPAEVRARGMPLGLMPGSLYEDQELILDYGEQIFMYSDGLLEAHNPQGDMFGQERIMESLAAPQNGKQMIEGLLDKLTAFACEGEQEDDITCVVVGRER